MKNTKNADISNIYRLDGQVPIMKAIPFGLQHILAMFVANLTPITIIAGAGGLKQAEIAILLQNAMFVAGIATLIQLYPVWKIGSRLPIVMGVSFTFVTVLSTVAANYGYPAVVGAVMIGGIMERLDEPSITIPSNGTFSPGCTTIVLSTPTSSGSTFSNFPLISIFA